jgi:hypothetical protein
VAYFKWLSIVLGSWMLLGGLWVVFFTRAWKDLVLKMCPEKRPVWLLWVNLFFLGLLIWTWYWFLLNLSPYSFVATFVVSLSLAKMIPAVFFYAKFREIVLGLMNEPVALRMVMLSSAAIGAALLTMGLFF